MAGMTQNNKKAFFHCGSSTKIKFSRKKTKKNHLSDINRIPAYKHLVRKQTLNHLARKSIWPVWLNS